MTQTDLIYRALVELKKTLSEDGRLTSFTETVAKAAEEDILVVTHNLCHVKEDWIAAIEGALEYIAGAIGEDRQFIRSNGEVKPIEKVRNVSRESVVHLSRHSDLITREPKEDDIIPDKLYTVERLSDYTVYENRFLYALVTRIRDFVNYRYDAIVRAYKTYHGELTSKKEVAAKGRKLNFAFTLTDLQTDALAAPLDSECAACLARMEKILQTVAFFLKTPLMLEVAKADKIKSKITKTNVLRMDKNFKEAVALYEFLLAYEGDGYTIECVVTKFDPVPPEIAQELALSPILSAFLVFEHGLGLEEQLREEFEREEARREEQRQAELAERIRALKKRVQETGMGMEEYMLLLEERNTALERDRRLLLEAQAEIEEMNRTIAALRKREEELVLEIGALNMATEKLKKEMEEAEARHLEKIEEMRRERAEAEAALNKRHMEALARAEKLRTEEVARVTAECGEKIAAEREKAAEKAKETALAQKDAAEARAEAASLGKECDLLRARLTALRREHKLLTAADDFTTEAGFTALEHEYEVLGKMVRETWEGVKKMLRKEFYGNLRGVMKKKPVKSAEYKKLSAEARARKKRAEEVRERQAKEGKAPDGEAKDGSGKDGKKD